MVDVLVLGAGPVGLTVAAELARYGVKVRIIERPDGYVAAVGLDRDHKVFSNYLAKLKG